MVFRLIFFGGDQDFGARLVLPGIRGTRDRALDGTCFDLSTVKPEESLGRLDAIVSLP